MCGATTAMVTSFISPRPWNAPMMPHTVPNRPTYGLIEPTLARNSRLRSSKPISRVPATCMARSEPSITLRVSCVLRWRWRANSRKPDSKMFSMPPLLAPPLLTSRNNWARSPPDQKRSSNASASSIAALVWVYLRMMITQDRNEKTSSTSSTSCTGRLESPISVKMFNPPFIACRFSASRLGLSSKCRFGNQISRNRCGTHALNIDASYPHLRADQAASVGLRDRLDEQDTGCAPFFDFDRYRQFIIQQGWLEEINLHVAHHEGQSGGLLERHLVDAERTHPLAAGSFHETQVAGVVDHAAGIGVFPVHPHRPAERRRQRLRHRWHRHRTGRLVPPHVAAGPARGVASPGH